MVDKFFIDVPGLNPPFSLWKRYYSTRIGAALLHKNHG
jgi:hypothetical protein